MLNEVAKLLYHCTHLSSLSMSPQPLPTSSSASVLYY